MKSTHQHISLALGSGGARGLAHIGVIRRLEEAGYIPAYIAGTSIGALIGGIYAAGKLDIYEEWARDLGRSDMLRLLDFSFRRGAIIKGDKVIDAICDLIGDTKIESLPIGFTAVATDMREQAEVWLNRGSLFTAIRASTAIPTLMSPVAHEGRLLADGGLVNPIPIAPTLNHGANLTIAVDLNGQRERMPSHEDADKATPSQPDEDAAPKGKYRQAIAEFVEKLKPSKEDTTVESTEQQRGFLHMSTQTVEIMQNGIARLKLAAYKPDMVISLPRDLAMFWEFDRAAELIEIGYERASQAIAQFETLRPDVVPNRTL
ncbi:MAG: patatin-like phospholipase family protein [Pseudomonadota bacterium]